MRAEIDTIAGPTILAVPLCPAMYGFQCFKNGAWTVERFLNEALRDRYMMRLAAGGHIVRPFTLAGETHAQREGKA